MRVLFDTSALIPALVEAHPFHSRALPWLMRARTSEIQLLVSCHGLAELYATLSSLPVSPRITPARSAQLVQDIAAAATDLVPLSPEDYSLVVQRLSERGLSGGVIYDALIARAAEKSRAEHLLTFNPSHFRRVWPEGKTLLLVP